MAEAYVSASDRAKFARLARDLGASETNDRGTVEQRAEIRAGINRRRVKAGLDPLPDRAPEEGLYERAKSLGMARIDR